jgi:CBS domain-containing protein
MNCPSCGYDNIPGDDLCADCGMDLAGLDVTAWGVRPDDPLLRRRISELPLKPALSLPASAPVADAVALMSERGEGCVFVTGEDGRLNGVVTERDVALRVAARGLDPASVALERVMTHDPFAVLVTDRLAFVLHRMGVDGYRHVPVVDGEGRLEGFVSIRTMLGVFAEL